MVVSTYQAASGAGAAAMEELELQTREVYFFLLSILFCFVTFANEVPLLYKADHYSSSLSL